MHAGGGGGGGGGSGFLPVPDEDEVRAPEPARRVRIADDAMLCTWALQTRTFPLAYVRYRCCLLPVCRLCVVLFGGFRLQTSSSIFIAERVECRRVTRARALC